MECVVCLEEEKANFTLCSGCKYKNPVCWDCRRNIEKCPICKLEYPPLPNGVGDVQKSELEKKHPDDPLIIDIVRNNRPDLLREHLSNKKIDVNARDKKNGSTALMFAAQNRFKECVEILLAHPKIDVNAQGKMGNGYTALHFAASHGRLECIQLILSHPKIDVNTKCKNNYTPLLLAAYLGKTECCKVLMNDPRTDINSTCKGGTAFQWAIRKDHFETAAAILTHPRFDKSKNGINY